MTRDERLIDAKRPIKQMEPRQEDVQGEPSMVRPLTRETNHAADSVLE